MDQTKAPRRARQYNPGQRRLRRAPSVAYDNPGTPADGQRTNDQLDMFNGAMDRYSWKLVGKKEMYVPANSYGLHSNEHSYEDIVQQDHIDQELPRYELRRVWVVESEVKEGTSHIYGRRTFYIDEDGWQIRLVDVYDQRGELWRFQEGHTVMAYAFKALAPVAETIYDFQNGRYLVQALHNEHEPIVERDFDDRHFDPSNVSREASR